MREKEKIGGGVKEPPKRIIKTRKISEDFTEAKCIQDFIDTGRKATNRSRIMKCKQCEKEVRLDTIKKHKCN
jgi:hypothetical protein